MDRRVSEVSRPDFEDQLCRMETGFGGPDHAVERCDGEGGLALLAGQGEGAKLRADQALVSADGSLDEVAPAVASGLLPSRSALLGDQLDVAVPRGLGSRVIGALHRRGARRDDHVR